MAPYFVRRAPSGSTLYGSYEIVRSDKRRIAAAIRGKPLPSMADFDGF
jgi:hypothetical protein